MKINISAQTFINRSRIENDWLGNFYENKRAKNGVSNIVPTPKSLEKKTKFLYCVVISILSSINCFVSNLIPQSQN